MVKSVRERFAASFSLAILGSTVKHFQNLRVSSAPALATVCPSGLRDTCRILSSWPERSTRWVRGEEDEVGEWRQMVRWLCGWPWEEISSW